MPSDHELRVLIVDDVRAVATALAMVIDSEADMTCVGTTATIAEARRHLAEDVPDVIVMDLYLPDGDGLETTAALRAEGLTAAVVLLTSATEPEVHRRAAEAGAHGVVAKGSGFAEIINAIRAAQAGGSPPPS
jgi:DNA-binding NarL/FixJ family response regulator